MSDHVKNDKEWYINYISGHIDKQVKPYHPNFGITEEEYNFLETPLRIVVYLIQVMENSI